MFKIINIVHFSADYSLLKDESPVIKWSNSNGTWSGIWEGNWSHRLINEMINAGYQIQFELWRPDENVDVIKEFVFQNGLIYKLFPAEYIKIWRGLRKAKEIYSPLMEDEIQNNLINKKKILIMLKPTGTAFCKIIPKKFKNQVPFLGAHFTNSSQLLFDINLSFNPIKTINGYIYKFQNEKVIKNINNLSIGHYDKLIEIKNRYKCNVFFNQFGFDSDYWKPSKRTDELFNELNLDPKKKIILFSSRINQEYQIDKVLDVISRIKNKNFICIFTYYGEESYMSILYKKIREYQIENLVRFTGFLEDEELKKYYICCDYFMSTAVQSAGAGSAIFALLMERPVITTDSGIVAEILRQNSAGLILPTKEYEIWYKLLNELINDKLKINILNREIAYNLFSKETSNLRWRHTLNLILESFYLKSGEKSN